MIPYGRHSLEPEDVRAVAEALESGWLTCGPAVEAFETAVARRAGAEHAVAVNSGTAALHTALHALGVGPGDEVAVACMSFASTANVVCFTGATPVFCDVDPDTLLLDPADLEQRITQRTKAVIPVDYAGQPCDYAAIGRIAAKHGLAVVADACHSLGAFRGGRQVGALADLTAFSFHPVKHIATGEGGMVLTNDETAAQRMRSFRTHCMDSDYHSRDAAQAYEYDIIGLGWNYRIPDICCALGLSQLSRLDAFLARRREIAAEYGEAFSGLEGITPLVCLSEVEHAYHLYVVRVDPAIVEGGRDGLFARLRRSGIGVNVHYKPIHLHSYYRQRYGTGPGLCPRAEAAYPELLTLPCYPGMSREDVDTVIRTVNQCIGS